MRAVRARAKQEHRVVHFVEFGVAGLLLSVLGDNLAPRVRSLIGIVILGLMIEYAQHASGRSPMEWWDVRDDTYAACLGCLLGGWRLVRLGLLRKTCAVD